MGRIQVRNVSQLPSYKGSQLFAIRLNNLTDAGTFASLLRTISTIVEVYSVLVAQRSGIYTTCMYAMPVLELIYTWYTVHTYV